MGKHFLVICAILLIVIAFYFSFSSFYLSPKQQILSSSENSICPSKQACSNAYNEYLQDRDFCFRSAGSDTCAAAQCILSIVFEAYNSCCIANSPTCNKDRCDSLMNDIIKFSNIQTYKCTSVCPDEVVCEKFISVPEARCQTLQSQCSSCGGSGSITSAVCNELEDDMLNEIENIFTYTRCSECYPGINTRLLEAHGCCLTGE